jgi:hypothetical protein
MGVGKNDWAWVAQQRAQMRQDNLTLIQPLDDTYGV